MVEQRVLRAGYILTEEECKEKGGHKYDAYFPTLMIGADTRSCRYCGHRQTGYTPDTVWEDVKE